MRRTAIASLGIAALSLLAACSGDGDGTSMPADSTAATVESTPASADGFTAPLVGGGEFSLVEELNSKPVALWFWAPG